MRRLARAYIKRMKDNTNSGWMMRVLGTLQSAGSQQLDLTEIPSMRKHLYVGIILVLLTILGGQFRDTKPASGLVSENELKSGVQHFIEQGRVARDLY